MHCAKQHGFFEETHTFQSSINSAWIVSQYANEYNPLHNHNGCDISAVIYLKCPDVKGRRNLESKRENTITMVIYHLFIVQQEIETLMFLKKV